MPILNIVKTWYKRMNRVPWSNYHQQSNTYLPSWSAHALINMYHMFSPKYIPKCMQVSVGASRMIVGSHHSEYPQAPTCQCYNMGCLNF